MGCCSSTPEGEAQERVDVANERLRHIEDLLGRPRAILDPSTGLYVTRGQVT